MNITYEFESEEEFNDWLNKRTGIDGLKQTIESQCKMIEALTDDKRKTIIGSDVVSDTYSIHNIQRVKDIIADKLIDYYQKKEECCSQSNLYSYVVRRVIEEYPTLKRKVCIALWQEAYEEMKKVNDIEVDKNGRVVYNKRVVGTANK